MGRTASSIELSIEDRKYLESQMRARTIQAQTAERGAVRLTASSNGADLAVQKSKYSFLADVSGT